MIFFSNAARWMRQRFNNAWTDQYPLYWHIINLIIGIALGIATAIIYNGNIGGKIGFFFAITPLGHLISLSLTYGIVRARNGWTKK